MALHAAKHASQLRLAVNSCTGQNNVIFAKFIPVQVSQTATLKHVGEKKYPYYIPYPYEKKNGGAVEVIYDNIVENSLHRMCEQSRVVTVEGNIGVGKHRFAKRLAEEFDLKYLPGITSDDIWIAANGSMNLRELNGALGNPEARLLGIKEMFTEDASRGRMSRMQYEILMRSYMRYNYNLAHLLSTGQGFVTVRSPFSSIVMARAMREMGWATGGFERYYHSTINGNQHNTLRAHLNIFLDAPVEVCMENIKRKAAENPDYEVGPRLNEDFLRAVDKCYRPWLQVERLDHEVIELDWAEPADEAELDVIFEMIADLKLRPAEMETSLYYDWSELNEDTLSALRTRFLSHKGMKKNLKAAYFPNDCDDLIEHYELKHARALVYEQHPCLKTKNNYFTEGFWKMFAMGPLCFPRPFAKPGPQV